MNSKEPGAIKQLFAFVGESTGQMRISVILAVLGGIVWYGSISYGRFARRCILQQNRYIDENIIFLWGCGDLSSNKNATNMAVITYIPPNFIYHPKKHTRSYC